MPWAEHRRNVFLQELDDDGGSSDNDGVDGDASGVSEQEPAENEWIDKEGGGERMNVILIWVMYGWMEGCEEEIDSMSKWMPQSNYDVKSFVSSLDCFIFGAIHQCWFNKYYIFYP